jgi:hypothetical protein
VAIAIDGSSPAIALGNPGPTATTASFTPLSNSVLIIGYAGNSTAGASPSTPTITDNLGSHLTYTLIGYQSRADAPNADGVAAMWRAVVSSSAGMTVSVTNQDASAKHGALKVWVLTGADTTTPVGASGKSGSKSAAAIAQSYTAQATSGWGFIAVCDWDVIGVETAGTGCTVDGSNNVATNQITYGFARRTTADDVNGNSNTLNVTIPGTSTNLSWAYAEVKPAAVASAPPPPRMRRQQHLLVR